MIIGFVACCSVAGLICGVSARTIARHLVSNESHVGSDTPGHTRGLQTLLAKSRQFFFLGSAIVTISLLILLGVVLRYGNDSQFVCSYDIRALFYSRLPMVYLVVALSILSSFFAAHSISRIVAGICEVFGPRPITDQRSLEQSLTDSRYTHRSPYGDYAETSVLHTCTSDQPTVERMTVERSSSWIRT
jgi:hypothetical protein